MCLEIFNRDRVKRVGKARFRKTRDGDIIAYKIISNDNKSIFTAGRSFPWFHGFNFSGRRHTDFDYAERGEGLVGSGFHVSAKLSDMRDLMANLKAVTWVFVNTTDLKIIRVVVNPKDVVAEGVFGYNDHMAPNAYKRILTLVCTKCTADLKGIE